MRRDTKTKECNNNISKATEVAVNANEIGALSVKAGEERGTNNSRQLRTRRVREKSKYFKERLCRSKKCSFGSHHITSLAFLGYKGDATIVSAHT